MHFLATGIMALMHQDQVLHQAGWQIALEQAYGCAEASPLL